MFIVVLQNIYSEKFHWVRKSNSYDGERVTFKQVVKFKLLDFLMAACDIASCFLRACFF